MALIKRNTAYSLNDIVNTKFGVKLKCITAGTTSTDPLILDGTSPITDGTVVWEAQEEGGSGQGLVDYEVNKNYNVGDIVIYDDKIYRCITAHTSTSTFDNTKWVEISAGITYNQYVKNNATANEAVEITVSENVTYTRLPVEVLKMSGSQSGVTSTLCDFVSGDSSKFNSVNNIEFDGSAHLQTEFNITMSTPTALDTYYYSESNEIDISEFSVIEEVDVQ